jgi:hypothetical protein
LTQSPEKASSLDPKLSENISRSEFADSLSSLRGKNASKIALWQSSSGNANHICTLKAVLSAESGKIKSIFRTPEAVFDDD